jgi:hypothetical protein
MVAAQVELPDVPFVPLRNLFVRELNRKADTFGVLAVTTNSALARVKDLPVA